MQRFFPKIGKLRTLPARRSRGVAIVEFALAAPFIILLIIGLFDLGLWFYDAIQVQGAAATGAQYAVVHRWNRTNIESAVQAATNFGTQVTPTVTQVCGCTDNANNFNEVKDGNNNPVNPIGASDTDLGDCSSWTCPNCTTSGGAVCPAGLYAKVTAEIPYSPTLPYPGLPVPLGGGSYHISGQAYRRLQ